MPRKRRKVRATPEHRSDATGASRATRRMANGHLRPHRDDGRLSWPNPLWRPEPRARKRRAVRAASDPVAAAELRARRKAKRELIEAAVGKLHLASCDACRRGSGCDFAIAAARARENAVHGVTFDREGAKLA